MVWLRWLIALCALEAAASAASAKQSPLAATGFIKTAGTNFVDANCHEFIPFGYNWWPNPVLARAIEAAAGSKDDLAFIRETFATAKNMSFNSFRFFAHGVDYGFVLHPAPGVYNETVWRGIDLVLSEAAKAGLRAVISPMNSMQYSDGQLAYNGWAGIPEGMRPFYTSPKARELYKNHMTMFANRVNTLTGIAYKDDPGIMAWNTMNELRCFDVQPGCPMEVHDWLKDVTAHIKKVAPNQMVSVGYEALFAQGSGSEYANPYGRTGNGELLPSAQYWAGFIGQDSFSHSSLDNIDYLAVHHWPDNWGTPDFSWATAFLSAQLISAARMNKPMLLEEFGKVAATWAEVEPVRNAWYDFWLGSFVEANKIGTPFKGLTFWTWTPEPPPPKPAQTLKKGDKDDEEAGGFTTQPGFVVYTGDETWRLLQDKWKPEIAAMQAAAAGSVVAGCTPTSASKLG